MLDNLPTDRVRNHGMLGPMTILAVFNQKGGVGKTTTSLNLLAAIARSGKRPIGVDLDPQAHLSHVFGTQPSRADEALTQTLKAALALVDVRVLDHVIVAPGHALSMAEKGLL